MEKRRQWKNGGNRTLPSPDRLPSHCPMIAKEKAPKTAGASGYFGEWVSLKS